MCSNVKISEMFEEFSSRIFLIDPRRNRKLTYQQCWQARNSLASALNSAGLKPGDRVMVTGFNTIEFLLVYLAALTGAFTAVPFSNTSSQKERQFIKELVRAKGLIEVGVDGQITYTSFQDNEPIFWVFGETTNSSQIEDLQASQDLCTIHFTSGTTSRPKGVAHSTSDFLNSCCAFNERVGFSKKTRMYHVLPMTYMAGFMNAFVSPMIVGGSIVVERQFDARLALDFWQSAIDTQVNTLWMAPSMVAILLATDRSSAAQTWVRSNIRTACVGTAQLLPKIQRKFEDRYGVRLLESYGTTEALFHTSNGPELPRTFGKVGPTLRGVEISLKGSDAEVGSEVLPKSIFVKCSWITNGYIDQKTGEPKPCDIDGWYSTGDVGSLDKSGNVRIEGRSVDLIIRGGRNISARAIEEMLVDQGPVDEVAVIGIDDELAGEKVVVLFRPLDGNQQTDLPNFLREICLTEMDTNNCPDRFIEVASFPKTITGKIQKSLLREEYGI